jgi:hypothetical protein
MKVVVTTLHESFPFLGSVLQLRLNPLGVCWYPKPDTSSPFGKWQASEQSTSECSRVSARREKAAFA